MSFGIGFNFDNPPLTTEEADSDTFYLVDDIGDWLVDDVGDFLVE